MRTTLAVAKTINRIPSVTQVTDFSNYWHSI